MDNNQLLKILQGIISIEVKNKEGNSKIIYVKEGINQHMEDINDKVTS